MEISERTKRALEKQRFIWEMLKQGRSQGEIKNAMLQKFGNTCASSVISILRTQFLHYDTFPAEEAMRATRAAYRADWKRHVEARARKSQCGNAVQDVSENNLRRARIEAAWSLFRTGSSLVNVQNALKAKFGTGLHSRHLSLIRDTIDESVCPTDTLLELSLLRLRRKKRRKARNTMQRRLGVQQTRGATGNEIKMLAHTLLERMRNEGIQVITIDASTKKIKVRRNVELTW